MNREAVTGLVLAAGFSSRMGRFKAALPLKGKPLLHHPVETLLAICDRVLVVTGYMRGKVEELMRPFPTVELVHNPDFETGMFSSVKIGTAAVQTPRFLLTPGDIPFFTQETCKALLSHRGNVISPVFNGKKGHPVLLDRAVRKAILAAPADEILRNILHRFETVPINTDDEGILLDIDTETTYNRVKENE
ncbi:MAG: nucleotidyltransferase family protein [Acidobacteria bacterium]|nr:MAG: nucleotidyltransferase family protein [Acidobacteriota bacterium]